MIGVGLASPPLADFGVNFFFFINGVGAVLPSVETMEGSSTAGLDFDFFTRFFLLGSPSPLVATPPLLLLPSPSRSRRFLLDFTCESALLSIPATAGIAIEATAVGDGTGGGGD